MLTFSIMTNGLFMSSRNISNLLDSTGYIAVLAVGMTLVIVIRHIDLSVGYAAGFMGAIAAILLTQYGLPVYLTIPIILVLGIIIGLFNGVLVASIGIPAFVASLAGMLIFRGALLKVTEKTGTINVNDEEFNALGNGFIPSIMQVNGLHLLSLIVGLLFIILYIIAEISARRNKLKYNFEVIPLGFFVAEARLYICDYRLYHLDPCWLSRIFLDGDHHAHRSGEYTTS